MASIYDHPGTYRLEHADAAPDIAFFTGLAHSLRPRSTMEFACGNGRLTAALAHSAANWAGRVGGIDASADMIRDARETTEAVSWHVGDIRSWHAESDFDLIVSACSSLSHLLTLEDQLAAWRNARSLLAPGGRFIVAETMPDYPSLAESMQLPGHATLRLDGDFGDGETRLLRCRASTYRAHAQTMNVRFFYDRLPEGRDTDRFVNDYHAHVYFPNELRLLFLHAGFEIEHEWGDYQGGGFSHESRVMVVCGRRG